MSHNNDFSYSKLGSAIRSLREATGLKQEYVALKAKIPQSVYSRIENGKAHVYINRLLDICNALEISPLLLLFCAGHKNAYRNKNDKKLVRPGSTMHAKGDFYISSRGINP